MNARDRSRAPHPGQSLNRSPTTQCSSGVLPSAPFTLNFACGLSNRAHHMSHVTSSYVSAWLRSVTCSLPRRRCTSTHSCRFAPQKQFLTKLLVQAMPVRFPPSPSPSHTHTHTHTHTHVHTQLRSRLRVCSNMHMIMYELQCLCRHGISHVYISVLFHSDCHCQGPIEPVCLVWCRWCGGPSPWGPAAGGRIPLHPATSAQPANNTSNLTSFWCNTPPESLA